MIELCNYGEWKGLPLYQCVLCPYSTLDKEEFIRHVEAKHIGPGYDKVVLYRCRACEFETDDEQAAVAHVRNEHRVLPEHPKEPQRLDRFGNPAGGEAVIAPPKPGPEAELTATEEVAQEVTDNGENDTDEDDD